MLIPLNDDLISVYAIVRIYEKFPNQVWIGLSDGRQTLVPQFRDKHDLKTFIINEMHSMNFNQKITRMVNDT